MRETRRLVGKGVLPSVLAMVVVAAAGIAGARGIGMLAAASDPQEEVVIQLEGDPGECVPDDPGSGEEGTEGIDEEGSGVEECQPGDGEDEGVAAENGEASGENGTAVTEEDCMSAAGVDGENGDGEDVKLTGLENAIQRVLDNCMRHPNKGLVNALTRLVANQEKHEAHEQAKAEEKAAREEEKAAKAAEREEKKAAKAAEKAGGSENENSGGGQGNGKAKGHDE